MGEGTTDDQRVISRTMRYLQGTKKTGLKNTKTNDNTDEVVIEVDSECRIVLKRFVNDLNFKSTLNLLWFRDKDLVYVMSKQLATK